MHFGAKAAALLNLDNIVCCADLAEHAVRLYDETHAGVVRLLARMQRVRLAVARFVAVQRLHLQIAAPAHHADAKAEPL